MEKEGLVKALEMVVMCVKSGNKEAALARLEHWIGLLKQGE
jgi:hypothetical protein